MLHQELKDSIKDALKAKDQVALDTLRGVVTALTNELVAQGKTPQEMLNDESVLTVIAKIAKQRKDAIVQFEKGGRNDLADEDRAQLAILEKYLPEQMGESEIRIQAVQAKERLGISDSSKKGILMAELMKTLKGKADGTVVKSVVDSLF
jgi:uncharacterized protein YqeY